VSSYKNSCNSGFVCLAQRSALVASSPEEHSQAEDNRAGDSQAVHSLDILAADILDNQAGDNNLVVDNLVDILAEGSHTFQVVDIRVGLPLVAALLCLVRLLGALSLHP